MNKQYRLCFVRDNVLYFTDDFEHQRGGDWHKRPYDCNAEEPNEYVDTMTAEQNAEHGCGHIKHIAFMNIEYYIQQPKDGRWTNCPYSVNDINSGAIAWLFHEEFGALPAGATMEQAIEWLRKAGCKWGELHE